MRVEMFTLKIFALNTFVFTSLAIPLSENTRSENDNALWKAAKTGNNEQLQTLIDAGVNVNVQTEFGATALYFAAANNRAETCSFLIDAGADPSIAENAYNNTPLGMAAWLGHSEAVEALLKKGVANATGALFAAAGTGHLDTVEVILEHGDVPTPVLSGVWVSAMQAGHADVAQRLEQAGAVPSELPDNTPPPEVMPELKPVEQQYVPVTDPKPWPSFRGPHRGGVGDGQHPPLTWNVPENRGVLWVSPIPGLGHSSPVIWGNRIFITSAVGENPHTGTDQGDRGWIGTAKEDFAHRFAVLCYELSSGTLLWETICHEGVPRVARHWKASHANSTCAVDDDFVIASFGSEGLYCLDHDGEVQWNADLGVLNAAWFMDDGFPWGYASSPELWEGVVFVQCDITETSFVAALDAESGEELWRTDRDEISSWGTPVICDSENGPELVTNGTNAVRSYDPDTGDELWRIRGMSKITVASPVSANGIVFATSAYQSPSPIYAIRLGASGDLTLEPGQTQSSDILWSSQRDGVYQPTPLIYQDRLYLLRGNGILSCFEAQTGKRLYRERVASGMTVAFTASPIAADGFLYLTGEDGEVLVSRAGDSFELVAINELGDRAFATPAVSNGTIVFRTHSKLIAAAHEMALPSGR